MLSTRLRLALPACSLILACAKDPLVDESGEADTGESDTSETDTTDSETTDTGGLCAEPNMGGAFASHSVTIDGEPVTVDEDLDLQRTCVIEDEGSDSTLTLNCGPELVALAYSGEATAAILDSTGASVQLHYHQTSGWNYASHWLRLDFVGEDLSVFLIDAEPLAPSMGWTNPWGLAVGQECLDDQGLDEYEQSLTLERDGQVLELWAGETGQIGAVLEVWVDHSYRYGPNAPAGDGPTGWNEVVIVSRGHLAGSEVCDPGADTCGPGLACCYPCGIGDCEYECQAEDPETMQCPPAPP